MTDNQKRKRAREKMRANYYKKLGRPVPPLNMRLSKAVRSSKIARKPKAADTPAKAARKERSAFVSDALVYITAVLRCLSTRDEEGVELYAKLALRALKGKV